MKQKLNSTVLYNGQQPSQGLYKSSAEHDACGIGMICSIKNAASHKIVEDGLKILCNLEHRGAVGADPKAGDGAGILIQLPHAFFAEEVKDLGFELPDAGQYGVAQLFLPQNEKARKIAEQCFVEAAEQEGVPVLGWRDVPVDKAFLGESVKATEPCHRQVFLGRPDDISDDDVFERKLYVVRKVASQRVLQDYKNLSGRYYAVSCSSRTIVYKGLVLADAVAHYFTDLLDERVTSAIALVHQRFSTNTFPAWPLAHPYRMICHNGEINTLRGNYNWMAARQASMSSPVFGDDMEKLWPISVEGQSDSACFDNALELLYMGGYSLPHAMMMLIPEAWAGNDMMNDKLHAFYEYNAALMEPWDGPAAMAFTDGKIVGATLDRNGLRPARYLETKDGNILLASEMGVLDIPEENIVRKWRLQPGKMLMIDLEKGKIISDKDLKAELSSVHPYETWLSKTQIRLQDLPDVAVAPPKSDVSLLDRQQAFGYTAEDVKYILLPMAQNAAEGTGAMGTDTPPSALSNKPKDLATYFKQLFAQVTNPPIDPIREQIVMSLVSFIGPRPNLLDVEGSSRLKRLEVEQPIITNDELEKIRGIGAIPDNRFFTATLDITYDRAKGAEHMEAALEALCKEAEARVRDKENIIILSDRAVSADRLAIPSLLATSAVHHHLIRQGLRTSVGLVVETGEAREVQHFATLAGFGAEAINPWLAFDTLHNLRGKIDDTLTDAEINRRYIKAVNKGLLKVMSKMGISTYQSYCGAQIFDAIGLHSDFIAKYFTGTKTAVEGIGLKEVAQEALLRHETAFGDKHIYSRALAIGGEYAVRERGEAHNWTHDTVANLQHAVRGKIPEKFKAYSDALNTQDKKLLTLRGLFKLKSAASIGRKAVPLEEVESAAEIVKRFATGAMSFGSISREAHTTLAIAMNRIGGKSNTGEGGEQVDRFRPLPNGDSMRSAIKQVASGRFGVTTEYLVNADMIQIKMAQGAKPGEGGQLPGHKVDKTIAQVRHSTPGVGLISPPPHHDIYSIEDLAQLIFDLKNVNSAADISVKLVSEIGVGTVAAGVAKARADHVTISGFEGGTGASPLTSIKHAGSPWEIGLAETQQTLVINNLRDRIKVQVDGGLRTGRDVVIGALLGADEFAFATAPLIAAGCIMMRKCHLNTCPVGIATQNPELRKKFTGQPEHVINYFFYIAEEVRSLMAEMGYRELNEMIGQTESLDTRDAVDHWKAKGVDFGDLFYKPDAPEGSDLYHTQLQQHPIDDILDHKFISVGRPALENKEPVQAKFKIGNVDRSAGAMLSGEVAKRYGYAGLAEDTIWYTLTGVAGQSFGAWTAQGVTLDLIGEGNDYVGKGLSGGKLIVRPHPDSGIVPDESMIVGNTVLYGAVTGQCYFRGIAGERFAVRNSGATAIVEGTGDHGCEYMTGGVVVVLGATGRNFAAGMSGGVAYVLDEAGDFEKRCNMAMVELEPIASSNGGPAFTSLAQANADLMGDDERRLRLIIENHVHYTASTRAQEILDNWDAYLPKFIKVMPTDYRRALLELKAEKNGQASADLETI